MEKSAYEPSDPSFTNFQCQMEVQTKKGYGSSLAELVILVKIFTVELRYFALSSDKSQLNGTTFRRKITENHPLKQNVSKSSLSFTHVAFN